MSDMNNAAGKEDGAAAADAAAAEAEEKKQPAGGAPEAGGGEAYKPEGLPDHLVGKSDKETIEKLSTAYINARRDLGEGKGVVPKSADAYGYDGIPDEMKAKIFRLDENGKDPVFEAMRPHLLAAGVTVDGAPKLLLGLAEVVAKIEAEHVDESADWNFTAQGGKEKAAPLIASGEAFITGLANDGKLDDADVQELRMSLQHGQGLATTLKLLRLANGGQDIPAKLDGAGGDGELTEAELNKMMEDPRYWKPGHKDPAYVAQVTQGFQRLYGKA
jgi:hypothetical protein